jgi:pimeloyl-ACP methyl ester carboxylesterase
LSRAVPDLRGHGRSRGLPPPYTTLQLAYDPSRLIDHLDIGSTAVLGYSAVCMLFAFATGKRPTIFGRRQLRIPRVASSYFAKKVSAMRN